MHMHWQNGAPYSAVLLARSHVLLPAGTVELPPVLPICRKGPHGVCHSDAHRWPPGPACDSAGVCAHTPAGVPAPARLLQPTLLPTSCFPVAVTDSLRPPKHWPSLLLSSYC
jgi:hypothetical protein